MQEDDATPPVSPKGYSLESCSILFLTCSNFSPTKSAIEEAIRAEVKNNTLEF